MVRLIVIFFLIALVIMVVLGVSLLRTRRGPVARREEPREILKRRYAAGEIDEDEYLRRMSGLSQDW